MLDAILISMQKSNSAKNDLPGAIASLNKIAERAYSKKNFYPSSMAANDLNEAIVTERMKEFAAEGKLWWDFIRLGVVFKKAPYLIGRENELNIFIMARSSNVN